MSKARKRERQPWWKRNRWNRKRRKRSRGRLTLVRFNDYMKEALPVRRMSVSEWPGNPFFALIRKEP